MIISSVRKRVSSSAGFLEVRARWHSWHEWAKMSSPLKFWWAIQTHPKKLCVVLYRLSRPGSYAGMTRSFGCCPTWLSLVFNPVFAFLCQKYRSKIQWHDKRLTLLKMQSYVRAIDDIRRLKTIWSFLDGTIARPGISQRIFYSGYKKRHGIKYQELVTPDESSSSVR